MCRHNKKVATFVFALLVGAAGPRFALALGDTTATAAGCSVAAGRDARDNSLVCNFGLSPEQVRELTEAAARGATGPLAAFIVDLSKKLGITEDATRTLLRIVGEQDVPLERLSETLNRVANDYRRLQAQVAALDQDNPVARGLIAQARAAIAAGDFPKAHELLRAATQAQIAAAHQARRLREQAQAAESAQLSGAAAQMNLGNVLQELGEREAGTARLQEAAAAYRAALEEWTRERAPLDWAMTQANLGNALKELGSRGAGTARLEEAVAAHRAALEEWTRERVPLLWAGKQNDLGIALKALGEREAGTARLEEAVAAYRAALGEFTRERVPLQWAYTQHGLANVLAALAGRQKDVHTLEEAVLRMRGAVEAYQEIGESHWLPRAQRWVVALEAALAELKR